MNHSETALKLVCGDRNEDYGNPKPDFDRIALAWSGVIGEKLTANLTAVEVGLLMVVLKCVRHAHKPKDDNLVDGHGYFDCIEWIETGVNPAPKPSAARPSCIPFPPPDVGDGYRWLVPGVDRVQAGDEMFDYDLGEWLPTVCRDWEVAFNHTYRRRITP